MIDYSKIDQADRAEVMRLVKLAEKYGLKIEHLSPAPCEYCGKKFPFSRPPGGPTRARKFCSRICKSLGVQKRARARKKVVVNA